MAAIFGPGGNSLSFTSEGHKHTFEAPAWVAGRGLGAYEYQAGNGITGSDETFLKTGAEASANNILMSLHAPYYISLSGIEPDKRLASIGYIEKSLRAAKLLGADIIVIHTGSAAKITRGEAMSLAADTIYKALEHTAGGYDGIKLGLETMGKQNQLGTLDEVLELCSIDSRLVPVVDFGHMYARETGSVFGADDADGYMRVFDAISEKLGADKAETLHCHFSKIMYTAAGEKKHVTFAENDGFGPDFEPLMHVIARNMLSPRIICESAGTMAEDAKTMSDYYESCL